MEMGILEGIPSLESLIESNYDFTEATETSIDDKIRKRKRSNVKQTRRRKILRSENRERRNKHRRQFNKFDYSKECDYGSASIALSLQRKKVEEYTMNRNDGGNEDSHVKTETDSKSKNYVLVRKHFSKTVRTHDAYSDRNPDHAYHYWPWGMPHHSIAGATGINLFRTCRFLSRIATRLLLLSEGEYDDDSCVCQALDLLHRVPAKFNQFNCIPKYVKTDKDEKGCYTEIPMEIKDQYCAKISNFKKYTKRQLTEQVNHFLSKTKKAEYAEGDEAKNSSHAQTSIKIKRETKQEQAKQRNRELQECANSRERNAFASYFKAKEDRQTRLDGDELKQEDNLIEEYYVNDDDAEDDDNRDNDDLFLTEEEIDKLNFEKEQSQAYEKSTMRDVYHPKGIDPSTIVLTTSYMLTKYLQDHERDNRRNIDLEDIDEYLRTCMEVTSSRKVSCNESTFGPKASKALVLSLIQSLYTFLSPTLPTSDINDTEEGGQMASSLRSIATDLVDVGKTYHNDDSLLRFSNLHLTTTLAQLVLCPFIPNSIVISISQPLDCTSINRRTPFDIFQTMFTLLHPFTSDDDLHDFINGLEKTLELLQLNLDQLPFEHISSSISWYLGILSCVTIASCGIFSIGKQEVSEEDLFVNLDIFYEYRKKTIQFLQRVLNVASTSTYYSSEYNIIISSFFEWKQVIYVLCGNHIQSKDIFSTISNIHSYFTYQCSLYFGNNYKYRIQELVSNQAISSENYKSYLANQLESHCDYIHYWIELVSALGPIGKTSGENKLHSSYNDCGLLYCQQCQLLNPGFIISHEEISKAQENELWWGIGRQWWYPSFLSIPFSYTNGDTSYKSKTNINKQEKKLQIKTFLLNHLSDVIIFDFHDTPKNRTATKSECSSYNSTQSPNIISFIPFHTNIDPDLLFQYPNYSALFPKHLREVMSQKELYEEKVTNRSKTFEIQIYASIHHEVTYKVIIACHLFTICHSFVYDGIQYLLDQCGASLSDEFTYEYIIKNENDDELRMEDERAIHKFLSTQDAFMCLCWLQGMGLDIVKIVEWNMGKVQSYTR